MKDPDDRWQRTPPPGHLNLSQAERRIGLKRGRVARLVDQHRLPEPTQHGRKDKVLPITVIDEYDRLRKLGRVPKMWWSDELAPMHKPTAARPSRRAPTDRAPRLRGETWEERWQRLTGMRPEAAQ